MPSFFAELKRRNVIRVAIAYGIVGWVLTEIASVVFDAFNFPDWGIQLFISFVVLGFPLVLIFAWAFEMTPEGIKRERDIDRSQSITPQTGRKLDRAIIALLVVALGYFVATHDWGTRPEPADITASADSDRQSVAVLPFTNRSADPENAFFADGVHDDLLTHLSAISALKVISRTSVLQYRDTTKTIPVIADELGVATVLEGAVQRAGDSVRINVQLIDADSDEHLWAQTFDRELSAANIFAIQSEIAQSIASALQTALTPAEQEKLATAPTNSLAAYDAYLIGRQKLATRNVANLEEAAVYFNRALEADPNFALAHIGLTDSYFLQVSYGNFPYAEYESAAETAISKALSIDNSLAEAYASLGALRMAQRRNEEAVAAYKRALELNPNYTQVYHWYGNVLGTMGRYEDALLMRKKAIELDPLSPLMRNMYAESIIRTGDFEEAIAQHKKALEIDPEFQGSLRRIGWIYDLGYGQFDEAIRWQKRAYEVDPDSALSMVAIGFDYLNLLDEATAEQWIKRAVERAPDNPFSYYGRISLARYRDDFEAAENLSAKLLALDPRDSGALVFFRDRDIDNGDFAVARERYAAAFPELFQDDGPDVHPDNYGEAINLYPVLMGTGESELAEVLLDKSLAVMEPLPRGSIYGFRIRDVYVNALRGDKQRALELLREATDEGVIVNWWYYDRHPNLASLHDEPEFKAILADIEARIAQQRANLEAAP